MGYLELKTIKKTWRTMKTINQCFDKVEEKKANQNVFHLWWQNKQTNKRFYAGTAYYHERIGDFSLNIHLLETGSVGKRDELFLRPVQASSDQIRFRLEKTVYRDGRRFHSFLGDAFQNKTTNGDIHISIEPFTDEVKILVLTLTTKELNHV